MSTLMHYVARASLPVVLGLLILTATARAGLWAENIDTDLARISRRYLEPLCTWSVVAAVVNAAAVVLAGDMGLVSLVIPIAAGCGAIVLLWSAEPRPEAEARPDPEPEPAPEPKPELRPAHTGGGLWAKVDESPQQRDGLWSGR